MATDCLFREDAYLKDCDARPCVAINANGGIVLDRTVFYAASGGQPGDRGMLVTHAGRVDPGRQRGLHRSAARPRSRMCPRRRRAGRSRSAIPSRRRSTGRVRHARMRMHTALHLLSAVLPYPVTGGSVGEDESRLDFDIPGGRPRQGRDHREARRDDRDRRRGAPALDHRRRARSQSRRWSRPCR